MHYIICAHAAAAVRKNLCFVIIIFYFIFCFILQKKILPLECRKMFSSKQIYEGILEKHLLCFLKSKKCFKYIPLELVWEAYPYIQGFNK